MTAINETRFPSLSLNTSASSMSLLSTFSLAPRSPAATTKVATQEVTLSNLCKIAKIKAILSTVYKGMEPGS